MTFLLQLEVNGHPKWNAGLDRRSQWTVRALACRSGAFNTSQAIHTEMKAVFSIEISGIISTSCSDATNSSSGGVTDVRRDRGSDMIAHTLILFAHVVEVVSGHVT